MFIYFKTFKELQKKDAAIILNAKKSEIVLKGNLFTRELCVGEGLISFFVLE